MKGKEKKFYSPVKQKILTLLAAGSVLGLRKSPYRQLHIFHELKKEWTKINRAYLYRCLKEFRQDRLVEYQENPDGTISVILGEEGKRRVLKFDFDNLTIKKPTVWDRRWRLVIFDVPEKKRSARDALRFKLRELGFREWQKSVFIHPYPCRDEIDFIMEFFEIRNHVRYGELIEPTNEAELKLHFDLT